MFTCDLHILFPFSEMHLHPSPLEKKQFKCHLFYEAIPSSPGRFKQMDHALVIFVFLEVIAVSSIVLASTRNWNSKKKIKDEYYCYILGKNVKQVYIK